MLWSLRCPNAAVSLPVAYRGASSAPGKWSRSCYFKYHPEVFILLCEGAQCLSSSLRVTKH